MSETPDPIARLMKRCQIGVGGRNALDDAHDIMAECYGTLGKLSADLAQMTRERAALRAEAERLRAALGCYIGNGPDHLYTGHCPDAEMWDSRDPECEACALLTAALQEPTP